MGLILVFKGLKKFFK